MDDATRHLLGELREGRRGAVAEALNLVDDSRPERRAAALDLLDALDHDNTIDTGWCTGVTGPPGAGKSSLLNALVRVVRDRDFEVGIVAVDPSSRRTGGALLGDRMRLDAHARESGVFLRSMAARDRLGGLADATHASMEIMRSVFDRVFVETVGIGQSESEISRLVDTLVFVVQPGAGDTLQFMKAGILEWPDIFVVNKADLGAPAKRTRSELIAGLGLGEQRKDGWSPPVLLCSAQDDLGLDALFDAIEAHRSAQLESGGADVRRREARSAHVMGVLLRRWGTVGLERIGGERALESRIDLSLDRSPFRVVEEIGREMDALASQSRPEGAAT
jgi:LAO/AO transport system kinase